MNEKEEKSINFLTNVIYGVFMGIFEVIPGISGGTLAFILGIYETLIGAISNIKKDGFYGGFIEKYAICKIYNIPIII